MSVYKALLAIYIIATTSPIYAGATTSDSLINSVLTRNTGLHSIYLDSSATIPDEGCDRTNYVVFDETAVGGKSMLGMALAAKIAGEPVRIRVSGCIDVDGKSSSPATAPHMIWIRMVPTQ